MKKLVELALQVTSPTCSLSVSTLHTTSELNSLACGIIPQNGLDFLHPRRVRNHLQRPDEHRVEPPSIHISHFETLSIKLHSENPQRDGLWKSEKIKVNQKVSSESIRKYPRITEFCFSMTWLLLTLILRHLHVHFQLQMLDCFSTQPFRGSGCTRRAYLIL